jgi:hypothetical protein
MYGQPLSPMVARPGGKASIFDLRAESSPDEIDALVRGMSLSALNSFWIRLTFASSS